MKMIQVYDDVDIEEPIPSDNSYELDKWWGIRDDFLSKDDVDEAIDQADSDLQMLGYDSNMANFIIGKWVDLRHSTDYLNRNRKRPITEMLIQIHQKIANHQLREGFKTGSDFDVSMVVQPGSISKWSNKTARQVFEAAKKNDKTALEYIFWKMKGAIQGSFWKNFLGPDGKIRQKRIQSGGWEEWLGIAWMSLVGGYKEHGGSRADKVEGAKGAIDTFELEEGADDEKIWATFAGRYKKVLINSSKQANFGEQGGGLTGEWSDLTGQMGKVTGYNTQFHDSGVNSEGDDEGGSDTRGYVDSTFDDVLQNDEVDRFMAKWRSLAQLPEMTQGTKGVSIADVLYEVLVNPQAEMRKMGEKFGIARNSVNTLLIKGHEIMSKQGITDHDLLQAIQILGNDKVASYLRPTGEYEGELKADAKIEDDTVGEKRMTLEKPQSNDDFLSKFDKVMVDTSAWEPHVRDYDVANWINVWIEEDLADYEKVASTYGIRKTDAKYWDNKARKLLKKYGISEEDLKKAIKSKGKAAIVSHIGEDT